MSFLFYSYAAHRLLHSFPTRRSSDLAHGVSHVPKYALPKSPRRPRPELRAVALPSNVPLSRAIFKLNSAWNHAVIPPPTVSVERRPQFDAWLVTPNFVVSSSVPSVQIGRPPF